MIIYIGMYTCIDLLFYETLPQKNVTFHFNLFAGVLNYKTRIINCAWMTFGKLNDWASIGNHAGLQATFVWSSILVFFWNLNINFNFWEVPLSLSSLFSLITRYTQTYQRFWLIFLRQIWMGTWKSFAASCGWRRGSYLHDRSILGRWLSASVSHLLFLICNTNNIIIYLSFCLDLLSFQRRQGTLPIQMATTSSQQSALVPKCLKALGKRLSVFICWPAFQLFCQVGWRCGLDIDIHTCICRYTYLYIYVCIYIYT